MTRIVLAFTPVSEFLFAFGEVMRGHPDEQLIVISSHVVKILEDEENGPWERFAVRKIAWKKLESRLAFSLKSQQINFSFQPVLKCHGNSVFCRTGLG